MFHSPFWWRAEPCLLLRRSYPSQSTHTCASIHLLLTRSYVDNLLRAAGTFDDMKMLRSYVYSRCHNKLERRLHSTPESDDDEEEWAATADGA